jgi:predicted metal-binding membrane protein
LQVVGLETCKLQRAAMMLGMMLPTAVRMLAAYAAVAQRGGQRYLSCLAAFVSAYVGVWMTFSLAAGPRPG